MSFTSHDIAAYQGSEVEVYVWDGSSSSATKNKLRGAQNFNTTEERSESRVGELGLDATKVVYGSASYSVSITLLIRDLVQLARISGIDPTVAKRLVVAEFEPVNMIAWYIDPDDNVTVNVSKYAGGFKSRTSSTPHAVDANTTCTLEGGADLIGSFNGKAECIQYTGDGSTVEFMIPDTTPAAVGDVYLVESPAGVINDDFTFNAADSTTPTYPSVTLDTAPDDNSIVRIVYKTT